MPTIITHPVAAFAFPHVSRGALAAGLLGTVLPDADVAAFAMGIPYSHVLGHRGFTHSIAFALLFSGFATLLVRDRRAAAFAFIFFCTMSHGVLDAFTDGGLGVAFFAPFQNERYFFPWTPIRVSPIGVRFFSSRGLQTLASELVWVWAPCMAIGLLTRLVMALRRR